MSKISLGQRGEVMAQEYLVNHGYRILECNYRSALGEIDIIAKEAKTLCFVEVKTRSSLTHGMPQEAVTKKKQLRLIQMALCYLKDRDLHQPKLRFDVVSILVEEAKEPEIELIQNAFAVDQGAYI